MKSFLVLALISVLAFMPVACRRDQTASEETVSANSERAAEPERQLEMEQARIDSARVPEGMEITVTLLDAVGTEINQEGDTFAANLAEPIIINGKVVAEKGSRVSGRVEEVEEPGKVKGRARLELALRSLTAGGKRYSISSEPFVAIGEDSKERDVATIAGGAAVGAAIGAVTGGKKGAAIGAAAGGGAGTTAVLLTRGKQLRLDPETRVNFVLKEDLVLPVIRRVIS
ncbi:MAG: hypothetical protein HY646_22605 [Acidobacteria bacterium]|nr:hypothetical protein [Acidobacteriota bacterium]